MVERVNLTIDGQSVRVRVGTTILEAADTIGIKIPTLCYMGKMNDIAACRMCVVEVEGAERLVASCNTPVVDGMVVRTATPRVIQARKANMEFLLAQHDSSCTTCVRNGNCLLQTRAEELNVNQSAGAVQVRRKPWDQDFPLIRDSAKCIRCLRCVQVCAKMQHCNVWDVANRGPYTDVAVRDGLDIRESGCTLCGQCVTHCPTGALSERDDTALVLEALADPDVIMVVQVAPSVRTSWTEGLDWPEEAASEGRMVAALRALGFDFIFDTNFAADMTIMEEGTEFLARFTGKDDAPMPLFTSCCPGWIRYAKQHHPWVVPHLSSAKSPQQIFGALLKDCYAPSLRERFAKRAIAASAGSGIGASTHPGASSDAAAIAAEAETADEKRIFNLSIMPCVAKKYECAVEEMVREADPDVDAVITVRELQRLLKMTQIDASMLVEESFDDPLDEGTGAAVIFGATGGVMEAALRSAYALALGENPDPDAFSAVRGMDGWKEKTFKLGDDEVRIAVVSGLSNADKLLNAMRDGEVEYDFVEVMACPGGCAGGGGQPIREGQELAEERGKVLYGLDRQRVTRFSHENPSVTACYEEHLGEPGSHRAHELLHTEQETWGL